jgi:hypothetical protein
VPARASSSEVRRMGKGALAPCPPPIGNKYDELVGTLRFAHPTFLV